jgi:hypothetical protein
LVDKNILSKYNSLFSNSFNLYKLSYLYYSTQIREKHPEDTVDHDSKTFSTTTTGSTTQVLEEHPEDTVDTDSKHSSCITTTGSTTQIRENTRTFVCTNCNG